MKRKCPRTLDKPLLMCGLELEDVAFLGMLGGLGCLLFDPLIPGVLTMVGWFILMEFKKDKPSGYLLHWLYNKGIDLPGLIPPVNKVKRYCIYAKTNDVKKFSVH